MATELHDRIARAGRGPGSLSHVEVTIACSEPAVAATLALAAGTSGLTKLALLSAPGRREEITAVADRVGRHLGTVVEVRPFLTRGDAPLQQLLVDAGDPAFDGFSPRAGFQTQAFALCDGPRGHCIAFGTDRGAVAAGRVGRALPGRAEVSHLAAELTVATLHAAGAPEIDPSPSISRIPLPPEAAPVRRFPQTVYWAGFGGAISHQTLWAIAIDQGLREAVAGSTWIGVDFDSIEESNRARQWFFPPESVGGYKADWTKTGLVAAGVDVDVLVVRDRIDDAHLDGMRVDWACSSVDSWSSRKLLARICDTRAIPWVSAGSSYFGGFARRIDARDPRCASADLGVEQLALRPDDTPGAASCSAQPLPSSVLPQMVIGAWAATALRSLLSGTHDARALARGIEVHLQSPAPGSGLRCSPGRQVNLRAEGT